jgi:hypothetical protein
MRQAGRLGGEARSGPASTETRDGGQRVTAQRWTAALGLLVVLWAVALFEPQFWVAGCASLPRTGPDLRVPFDCTGGATLLGLPKFLYLALAFITVLKVPGGVWYLPLLVYVMNGVVMIPFTENSGLAFEMVVKILLPYYILAVGTFTFVRGVDKTHLLLHLFLWQFLWWSFHGDFSGLVSWHPKLRNEDAFGPLMVMGAGYCYYVGMAVQKRGARLTAFCLAGLCVVGVVSSFARGAVLAAGVVTVYIWLRSPHKTRTFTAAVFGVVIFVIAANVLFPGGLFWHEMSTISKGFEDETGYDRWVLWKTAWRAFLERPLFGVGAGNFSVFASANLWSDPALIARYEFPGRLWGRAVHSIYFQLISEFGLIGTIAFTALLTDFWKRNRQLRSAALRAGWAMASPRPLDLRMVSLGLEAAMIAYLATGVFYDQLYEPWFYLLLTLNAVVHRNVSRVVLQQRAEEAS